MKPISKVIPPRSRVRLIRADERTPNWRKDVGRQFRVGYYSRKDGLGCIWLVNEKGEYEQTTDAKFLGKYFDVERLSAETNLYGLGKRRFAKMRVKSALERLNGRSAIDVFEAAKELWEKGDTTTVRGLIDTLRRGKRVLNRTAAAYALNLANAKTAIRSLEISVANRREHPKVTITEPARIVFSVQIFSIPQEKCAFGVHSPCGKWEIAMLLSHSNSSLKATTGL